MQNDIGVAATCQVLPDQLIVIVRIFRCTISECATVDLDGLEGDQQSKVQTIKRRMAWFSLPLGRLTGNELSQQNGSARFSSAVSSLNTMPAQMLIVSSIMMANFTGL